ncbi:g2893 [Coccomyxa elongata]
MGPPVLVADVVLWPDRSIIKQSYDARERKMDTSLPSHLAYGNLNGDGFGIGWFTSEASEGQSVGRVDPTPCVFTSITPAWNNENLGRLSCKIISPLVFAHVRAAMPGMPVSEQNCHPFQWGRYMWMHNGMVGGFMKIRRALLSVLSDAAYDTVQSFHSDSAVCFSVFLHHLPDLTSQHPPHVLLRAIEATFASITAAQEEAGITEVSLLNFAMSDGSTLIATRYVSHEDEEPASLYYAEGSAFQRCPGAGQDPPTTPPVAGACKGPGKGAGEAGCAPCSPTANAASARNTAVAGEGEYCLRYGAVGTRVALVASEPITRQAGDWVAVPRNTALIIISEKGSCINVMHSAIGPHGAHPRQEEVAMSLEAVCGAVQVQGRPWQQQRKRRRDGGKLRGADSTPGPLKMDEGAHVVTGEDQRLTGHTGALLCLALLDKRLLFSSSTDLTIKVWDLAQGKCMRTLTGHSRPVQRLHIAGGRLYSIGGRSLRVWDLATYTCLRVLQQPRESGALSALAVAPHGIVYVAGQDASIKAFRPESEAMGGPEVVAMNGHAPGALRLAQEAVPDMCSAKEDAHCGAVQTLALCGSYLCSAGGDAMIRIWDASTLALFRVLRGHRGSVLTLYTAGNLLLSGGRDNIIRVWDMETFVCRQTLTGHKDDVLSISGLPPPVPILPSHTLSPHDIPNGHASMNETCRELRPALSGMDGAALIISSSADATVRLWRSKCWSCLRIFTIAPGNSPSPPLPFLSTALSPEYTVTGSEDGIVRLWNSKDIYDTNAGGDGPTSSQAPECTLHSNGASERARIASSAPGECSTSQSDALQLERELEHALRDFVRLKTVSSDPTLQEDCFRGAKFLATLLEALGAEIKLSRPVEDKNPVVIGRLGRNPDLPTVTFYGHYDVQPAMEREWATDPFEVAAIDGYFYGRGTSDNKGPILAFVYAVKEMLKEGRTRNGSLPVNVAFVFEGEEENGSAGFREAVQANLHWFEGTQLIIISNTLWVGEEVPCLTYGMRGMIAAAVEVKGPARDLHSGNDGGVFNEPLADLMKVLASLVDNDNRILVPGFHDLVRPNTLEPALERLTASSEFSLDGYRAALGIPRLLKAQSTRELLRARWCEPALSVVDVRVGDDEQGATDPFYRFGPTRFSVIPRSAVGNVSVRFVPDQDAGQLIAALRAHVEAAFAVLGSSNTVGVRVKSVGDWWEADPESKLFKMAERALTREWGRQPLFVREGGTMPVASALEKMLGAPALLVPFGQSSDACHLANERLQRINLVRGKNVIKNLLYMLETADV